MFLKFLTFSILLLFSFSCSSSKQNTEEENGDNGVYVFDTHLVEKIKDVKNPRFNIKVDKLGQLDKSTSSVALVFGLEGETSSFQKIAGYYQLTVEVSAQALFFDFNTMSVVCN